ncbi:MAG: hypothetical protein V3W41_20620 [Planctomycetota bacterium]
MSRLRAKVACAVFSIGMSVLLVAGGGASVDSPQARGAKAVESGWALTAAADAFSLLHRRVVDAEDGRVLGRGPGITLAGGASSGGTLTGHVENVPAPAAGDDTSGATVVVKIDGWLVNVPKLFWSAEDQAWKFEFDVPNDLAGATVTLTATNDATGSIASTSIAVI